jgi:hypothetical protein
MPTGRQGDDGKIRPPHHLFILWLSRNKRMKNDLLHGQFCIALNIISFLYERGSRDAQLGQLSHYSDQTTGEPNGESKLDSRRGQEIFLFSWRAPRVTQPLRKCVPEARSLWKKRPGREADHWLPPNVEVANRLCYISTPLHVFVPWWLSTSTTFTQGWRTPTPQCCQSTYKLVEYSFGIQRLILFPQSLFITPFLSFFLSFFHLLPPV